MGDLRYSGMSERNLQAEDRLLHEGDLLFTRYSGSSRLVGLCAAVPRGVGPLTFPDKLIRVRVDNDIVLPSYAALCLAVPDLRRQIVPLLKTTAGQVGISGASIKRIRLPLPPLAEQRRIVEVLEDHLSRLDSAAAQIEQAGRRISKLRDQVMAQACLGATESGDLTQVELRPAGVSDGDLPYLPPGWSWTRLGEIADVVGGVTKDRKRQTEPSLSEFPYLRVANVQRGRLDLSTVATIRVPADKAKELFLRAGDVLLNEGGDRDKLGRGWIWEGQISCCIHQNHVFRARIRDDLLEPKLLAWHANGCGRRWCQMNGTQSVNLASISLRKIKLLPVPLPPVMQQRAMVEETERRLSLLDAVEQVTISSQRRAVALRRALLSEAFAGRLVPQDPNDEPAAVLLQRIRAERAVQPARRRGRRGRRGAEAGEQGALL